MNLQTHRRKSRSVASAVSAIGIAVFVLILNVPFLTAVWTSIRTTGDISAGAFTFSQGPVLAHYSSVLSGTGLDFQGFYINSISLSLLSATVVTLIAFPAAFGIVRLGFGVNLLRIAVSLRILPAIFFVIPFFLMFVAVRGLDTIGALVVANAFLNLPLGVLILASSFSSFPTELEDAALVDGLGAGKIMTAIALPLMRPAVASVFLLTFLFSWSEYLFALTLSSRSAVPLTVGTANFVTSAGVRWGEVAAATVMAVAPPMLLSVVAQRHLVRGLTSGAVKG